MGSNVDEVRRTSDLFLNLSEILMRTFRNDPAEKNDPSRLAFAMIN